MKHWRRISTMEMNEAEKEDIEQEFFALFFAYIFSTNFLQKWRGTVVFRYEKVQEAVRLIIRSCCEVPVVRQGNTDKIKIPVRQIPKHITYTSTTVVRITTKRSNVRRPGGVHTCTPVSPSTSRLPVPHWIRATSLTVRRIIFTLFKTYKDGYQDDGKFE